MIRHEVFTLSDVFNAMERGGEPLYTPSGKKLKVSSLRLRLFKTLGPQCVSCPVVGTFFALESFGEETPHLNLYGMLHGQEVLMTKDHIHPKSKGGLDVMDNFQTMCAPCNFAKADTIVVQ